MYNCKYPHLFEPIQVGNRIFKNRIFNSPTGNTPEYNVPEEDVFAYYERKAMGGAASVCVGDACVDRQISFHGEHHINPERGAPGLTHMNKLTRAITRHGAVASLEIMHGGGSATGSYDMGHTVYGPVAGSMTTRGVTRSWEEMPEEIIELTIQKFYDAALIAKQWGFGMITIHGGHGWLLTQFMAPDINKRKDKWGGSFENNMRLPLAIVDAVRRAVGPGFPIEMRISGAECYNGGYDIDYGIRIAEAFDGKVDIIHVSTGSHENDDTFTITHPSMFLPDGCNVKYAAAIKPHIKHSKVATVGALSDPALMEEIIASGQADIVEMARGLICDPDIPIKARTGREDEIRHCMRCFACFGSLIHRGHIICAQNPEIGHEREFMYAKPPVEKKKVLIVGGGIGGMEAAITCAEQGHEVVLCEKGPELGGILRCEGKVPFKHLLEKYLDQQQSKVEKAAIDLRLNTEVTPEYAQAENADVIICAVGATPSMPPIPGLKGENVVDVVNCYKNPEKTGENVVVLGGGYSGLELSIYLTESFGRKCTVLEMAPQLSDAGNFVHALALAKETRDCGVDVRTGTKCVEITDKGVWAEKDGERVFFPADTVAVALGMRARNDVTASLANCAPEFYTVGDCNTPRNIFMTTDEAHSVALDIGRI